MRVVARSEDWLVVDGPVAAADPAVAAAAAGEPAGTWQRCFDAEPAVAGVQLFARGDAARERLTAALSTGEAEVEYRALAPLPPWDDGWLRAPWRGGPAETRFERGAARPPLCELALATAGGQAGAIRFHLADAGFPIAGSGAGEPETLRLRRSALRFAAAGIDARGAEPDPWWPPAAAPAAAGPRPVLRVSRATVRALERGHPWVLRDAETSDVAGLTAGTLVDLRGPRGRAAGVARVEGPGSLVARLWSAGGRAASVEERVAAALARRRALLADADLEAVRLVHGEADGLPGLAIDRLGPLLRVLLTGRSCQPVVERAVDAVIRQLAPRLGDAPPVVRVVHLADPPVGRLRAVALARGTLDDLPLRGGRLAVRERDLAFWVDPGLDDPYRGRPGTGLFLDQRDNRARVRAAASGGRWLNLFCHTGAFSAAALAGGAREVTSVDLSAPYLAWLEANLALSQLPTGRHRSVQRDARRYLEQLPERAAFDGIVLDPPTAARAGRRFWSVRREGGALLAACLRRLRPGGALLACRNDRAPARALRELLEGVAGATGVRLERVEAAPPAPDFPRLAAFPEGDAFAGVWARRAG